MFIRKIKQVFTVLVAVSMLQACTKEEVIELTPQFSLDALTNPSSMDQVEQVLTGAYARFRAADYYSSSSGTGAGWAIMPDIMSDNLYETVQSLANSRTMADWLYNPNTVQIENMYAAPYGVIAAANIVIRDVDKFTTATNQTMGNRIKGQALAIRAMAHFDLFRYFASKYDRNSTSDLAVAYIKEFTVSTEARPSRLSNKEFYDALFADLSQAATLLANVDKPINPASGLTRPNLDLTGVQAIQARAYLYAGMWAEAIAASTSVINARPLASRSAFPGMYNQTSAGEIIWNIQVESGQSGPTYLIYFPAQGSTYFRPAPEVATVDGNSGLLQNNDVRYSTYFTNVGGGLAVTKYKGKNGNADGSNNFIVFRTGEMYLIRAEARARSGQEGPALTDLNDLRAARITGYTPVSGLTGSALLSAIADERRRELIAEGHRFFDLKRTTRTITRGIACGNTTVSASGVCTLASSAREWALPIPEAVTTANGNAQQNPGY
jgi:hypothetical protein